MNEITARPPRGVHGAMFDFLADCLEAQSEELVRFIRVASDQMLTAREVAGRLGISMKTFYNWKASSPWKLPNFGASATGGDYRCSLMDFYDWYHVPGVINVEEYHHKQWDQMSAQARKEALGIPA